MITILRPAALGKTTAIAHLISMDDLIAQAKMPETVDLLRKGIEDLGAAVVREAVTFAVEESLRDNEPKGYWQAYKHDQTRKGGMKARRKYLRGSPQ